MEQIYELKINRSEKTTYVSPADIMFSFKARRGEEFTLSVMCRGEIRASYKLSLDDALAFYPDCKFVYGEKYEVCVENELGDICRLTFETAEKLDGKWLETDKAFPIFRKVFDCAENPGNATLTVTALGVYVAYLNGKRLGDNYLAPGMNDYDGYVRYQTYKLTDVKPTDNVLEVWVGDGWYKGRFGVDGHGGNIWGSSYLLNAVITVGTDKKEKIYSDESWTVSEGYVTGGSIYDGEIRDDTRTLHFEPAKVCFPTVNAIADGTSPITAFEERNGRLLITPRGENVIDFGQNASGIVSYHSRLKKGETIHLYFGEILQDGNFYRDNLRSAKAEYVYTSDGNEKSVLPLFTFYGFRYVKIECDGDFEPEDFTAIYLSTQMSDTMKFATDNAKLNKLIQNIRWGQKSNFLDIPTDCPQRDERLGWTADTQIFAATASYNAETYNFYKKYMNDLFYDQKMYYGGDFPMYSPSLKGCAGHGGAVWADAGVIIPWELYKTFGDKVLLAKHYDGISEYIKLLIEGDENRVDGHILGQPFTFGDWLAHDGICAQSLKGGTDDTFIRSAYYYYVVSIFAQMGKLLGKQDSDKYQSLSEEIKSAIYREYFTSSGRFALDTQAAYIVALRFGLYTNKEKLIDGFKNRLTKDLYKIKCGFVGGPVIIQTLFDNGLDEEAFRILFNEGYPGWLYEVGLGATTVWERWNSVDCDGHITGIFMNSLNHYAYGTVAEGIYKHIGGLSFVGSSCKDAVISPRLSPGVISMEIAYDSPRGTYSCEYMIIRQKIRLSVSIPHGCRARLILPCSDEEEKTLGEGEYTYEYSLNCDIEHPFSENSLIGDILAHSGAREVLKNTLPATYALVSGENEEFQVLRPAEMLFLPMYQVTRDGYKKFVSQIRKVTF